WAQVDVELQRRYDLIANLVGVTKAYARHEGEALLETVGARGGHSLSVDDANQATRPDGALLQRLLVRIEQYPELKAEQQVRNLQQALIETENRIATRRNAYNECVSRYETDRHQVPAALVAWAGRFGPQPFFDAQDETAQAVKVMLS